MTGDQSVRSCRILVVAPSFLEWDLGTYVLRLLEAKGIAACGFAYRGRGDREVVNQALLAEVERCRPEILLGLKMGQIEPETLRCMRAAGTFVALWYVDCFSAEIPPQMARLVPEVDTFLTTAKGMLPFYQALSSTPGHWVYEGVYLPAFPDLEMAEPLRRTYGSQVTFVGNIFHPPVADERLALHRYRLLRRVCERFALKIWGPQGDLQTDLRWDASWCPIIRWPAYHEELVKICRASDLVLGLNTINSVELYFSNRTFLTLACGGFHLTHYVPGLEQMFENHRHLVWFESDDECLDLIAYYLARPEQRRQIATEGQTWVRQHYGMDKQVDRILQIIGAQRVS